MMAYYHNHPNHRNSHFSTDDKNVARNGKNKGFPDVRSQWPGHEIPLNMQIPPGIGGGVYVFRHGKWITLLYVRVEITPGKFEWRYFQIDENGKITRSN